MSNIKYTAPKVDIVEFGNEDLVCVVSGWTPDGNPNHGFDVKEETDEGDDDF